MNKYKNICHLCSEYEINPEALELYGNYKAKVDLTKININRNGKIILVTSTSPTPSGEGKTTIAIGINDALCRLKKRSTCVLREPSLGPVFGQKGGATGGGCSALYPQDDINLHFTGDMHAITSCNNLLAAIIDNHIYQGNALEISKVCFKRCLDVNDRELRHIKLYNGRDENFIISAASEIMAILCLSKSYDDLKERLSKIVVGFNKNHKAVYVKDLKCTNALYLLLKDAFKPNVVQSLENNLVVVHGGPFANIAHGCASIQGLKLASCICDYVVVEAGFASDMGGFKFFDIVCRSNKIYPSVVVINTTIKSLLYNGNNNLDNGFANLKFHIDNMLKFTQNIVVVLNQFAQDTEEQIKQLNDYCIQQHVEFAICNSYAKGSLQAVDAATKILKMSERKIQEFKVGYDLNAPLMDKIKAVAHNYLNAKEVIVDKSVEDKFALIAQEFPNLPICLAKTPVSISDNKNYLGNPCGYTMRVTDINIANGAGFIVVYMGNILTMPGLNKDANYLKM